MLVSPSGEKIDFTFEWPEYNDGDDYADNDYNEETGYLQCQKQCLARYKWQFIQFGLSLVTVL